MRGVEFIMGFERAEREFYRHESDAQPWHFPNPFDEGTEAHAGYEEAVYIFTQK